MLSLIKETKKRKGELEKEIQKVKEEKKEESDK